MNLNRFQKCLLSIPASLFAGLFLTFAIVRSFVLSASPFECVQIALLFPTVATLVTIVVFCCSVMSGVDAIQQVADQQAAAVNRRKDAVAPPKGAPANKSGDSLPWEQK